MSESFWVYRVLTNIRMETNWFEMDHSESGTEAEIYCCKVQGTSDI
jgi:hypothetical protein